MKANKYIRASKGYLGEYDDGPYAKWKKHRKKRLRSKERQTDKREIRKELKRVGK